MCGRQWLVQDPCAGVMTGHWTEEMTMYQNFAKPICWVLLLRETESCEVELVLGTSEGAVLQCQKVEMKQPP